MKYGCTAIPMKNGKEPAGSSGVSEVIGAILLIAIVVAFLAIILAFINTQNPVEQIPNVNFMVGVNAQNPPTLFITHNGGDTLSAGSFLVLVDGVQKAYTIQDGGTVWSLGKNLVVPLSSGAMPGSVTLVYNSSWSGPTMLGSVSSNISAPQVNIPRFDITISTPVPTQTPSVQGMINNSAADIVNSTYFIPALQQNVTGNSISLWKAATKNENIPLGYSCNGLCFGRSLRHNFTYTVSDPTGSSLLMYGSPTSTSVIPLNNGDVVTVSLSQNNLNYVVSFGIAPQIWEFAAKPCSIYIRFANGTSWSASNTELVHTYVGGYSNIVSTLVAAPGNANAETMLKVNGTERLNGLSTTEIAITNIRPLPVGLYVIAADASGNSNLYIVANGDAIYYGTTPQVFL